MRIDPDRARDVRVTLVEAMQLLSSFDSRLREYAARSLHQQVQTLLCKLLQQSCQQASV